MKTHLPGIFFIFCQLFFQTAIAQQDPLVSQYMLSGIYLNPAAAGTYESLEISAMHRNQWYSFNSNPTTEFVNISAPVNYKRIGIGGQVMNVSYQELRFIHLHMAASYKIRVRSANLSAGLEIGTRRYSFSYNELMVKDVSDKVLYNANSSFIPDFGAGIYCSHPRYYFGFSAKHLNQGKITFPESAWSGSSIKAHYYFTGGYKLALSDQISLMPTFLLKYIPMAPLQADLTFTSVFYQLFWAGITLRSSKEAGILVGIVPNKIVGSSGGSWKIGYAFDYGFNKLSANYQTGSHEIILLCQLKPRPNAEKIRQKTKITSPMLFGRSNN